MIFHCRQAWILAIFKIVCWMDCGFSTNSPRPPLRGGEKRICGDLAVFPPFAKGGTQGGSWLFIFSRSPSGVLSCGALSLSNVSKCDFSASWIDFIVLPIVNTEKLYRGVRPLLTVASIHSDTGHQVDVKQTYRDATANIKGFNILKILHSR
jgi:hypothetical protein